MSRTASSRVRSREVRKLGVVCLLGLGLSACEMAGSSGDAILGELPGIAPQDSQGPVETPGDGTADPIIAVGVQVDAERARAIRDAATAYVRQQTAIDDVAVEIDAVADGWARVRVLPAGSATDPATLYLREEGGAWRGIAIGTAFTPPDLDEMGIPAEIRP
jgi:hypothetical protein